jgi:hypothetical protein
LETTGEAGEEKAGEITLPLRKVTCGGAQVALQQRLILRPGNIQFIKNLNGKGGQFWVVATIHFSICINTKQFDYGSSSVRF